MRAQSRKPSRLDLFMFECEKNFEDRQCQKGGPKLRVLLLLTSFPLCRLRALSPRVFIPNFIVGQSVSLVGESRDFNLFYVGIGPSVRRRVFQF